MNDISKILIFCLLVGIVYVLYFHRNKFSNLNDILYFSFLTKSKPDIKPKLIKKSGKKNKDVDIDNISISNASQFSLGSSLGSSLGTSDLDSSYDKLPKQSKGDSKGYKQVSFIDCDATDDFNSDLVSDLDSNLSFLVEGA